MDLVEIYYDIKNNFTEQLKEYTPVPPDFRHLLMPGVLVKYCNIKDTTYTFLEGVVKKIDLDYLYIKTKTKPKRINMAKFFIFYKVDENDIMNNIFYQIAEDENF